MAGALTFKTATRNIEVAEAALDHAEIEVHGNAAALTLTTQNAFQQITDYSENGLSAGPTADHTNDHITINDGGAYFVHLAATISGDGNQTYELQVYRNNGAEAFENIHVERKLNAGGDTASVMTAGLVSLLDGDTIETWARCTSGNNKDITVEESTLIVVRVGD